MCHVVGRHTNIKKSIKDLAESVTTYHPLIVPLFSIRDSILSHMRFLYHLMRDGAFLLCVSYSSKTGEDDSGEVHEFLRANKIKEVALKFPNVLVLAGNEKFFYHLPIRDLSIYHENNIEVRLVELGSGKQRGHVT